MAQTAHLLLVVLIAFSACASASDVAVSDREFAQVSEAVTETERMVQQLLAGQADQSTPALLQQQEQVEEEEEECPCDAVSPESPGELDPSLSGVAAKERRAEEQLSQDDKDIYGSDYLGTDSSDKGDDDVDPELELKQEAASAMNELVNSDLERIAAYGGKGVGALLETAATNQKDKKGAKNKNKCPCKKSKAHHKTYRVTTKIDVYGVPASMLVGKSKKGSLRAEHDKIKAPQILTAEQLIKGTNGRSVEQRLAKGNRDIQKATMKELGVKTELATKRVAEMKVKRQVLGNKNHKIEVSKLHTKVSELKFKLAERIKKSETEARLKAKEKKKKEVAAKKAEFRKKRKEEKATKKANEEKKKATTAHVLSPTDKNYIPQKNKVMSPASKIPKAKAGWTYMFWIYIKAKPDAWAQVFHKGTQKRERGPAVWLIPKTTKLHIRSATKLGWNTGINSAKEVPMKQWTHVAITHKEGELKVWFNGVPGTKRDVPAPIENEGPLYSTAPWYDPAVIELADFIYIPSVVEPSKITGQMNKKKYKPESK